MFLEFLKQLCDYIVKQTCLLLKTSVHTCILVPLCVSRDAERTSEERASTAGGSLLCSQYHGGGQTSPDQGTTHTTTHTHFILGK